MFLKPVFSVAIAVLCASPVLAAPPATATEQTQTKGVFGITIPFGGDGQPRFSIGLRRMTVGSNGDLSGSEVRLVINPRNPGDVQLRALGLRGSVDHAGALGGGWDFGTGRPFASGGVVLPYLTGVADFGLGGFAPSFSFGIDSLGRPDTPAPLLFAPCGGPAFTGPIAPAC